MSGFFITLPRHLITDRGVSPTQLTVIACLSTYADQDGWCYPRIATISSVCALSRSTVKRALYDLIERGYLERTERVQDCGRQTSNLYRVIYDPARLEAAAEKAIPILPAADIDALDTDDEPENDHEASAGGSPVNRGGGSPVNRGGGSPVNHLKRTHLLNDKKNNNPPTPLPRGDEISGEGWALTPALVQFAGTKGFSESEAHELFAQCQDHYAAIGSKIDSPSACFRNWVRRAIKPKRSTQAAEKTGDPPKPEPVRVNFLSDTPAAIRDGYEKMLEHIAGELGPVVLKQWFALCPVRWNPRDNGEIEIIAPSAFHRDWLRDKFGHVIERARAAECSEIVINVLNAKDMSHAA